MLIQEDLPRPAQPLATLDEDYDRAVVHLVWGLRVSTNERPLLFAMVELLPIEVPSPLDDGEERESMDEGGDRWIHLRRVVVPARNALAWYLGCRRGFALLPNDAGDLPDGTNKDTTGLVLADLGEEPPWPTLVCVSEESNTVPFSPAWHAGPRVHHLVPLAPLALAKIWPDEDEQQHATQWIADRLHFSLENYPEYWGSVHLVAPNPVYRALQTRLFPSTPPRESVLVRFQPRVGKSVEGLELAYTDKEPWGPLDVRHIVVRSPLLRLDFDREVQGTKHDVFDPKRGMLEASYQEAHFLKSIQINVGLVSARLRVEGKTPDSTYEVNRTGAPERRAPADDTSRSSSARGRMVEAHFARIQRGRAHELDQLWFSGQREEAADAVRSRITAASREVLIVDRTFGPGEVFKFGLAVSRSDVPVRILASAEFLTLPQLHLGRSVTLGELLVSELDRIASSKHTNPCEVRVMGAEPSIDEALLLVDDRIWLLGTTLRDFGSRGTLMVGLPNPVPIRKHVLDVWGAATELRCWLETRGECPEAGPQENP